MKQRNGLGFYMIGMFLLYALALFIVANAFDKEIAILVGIVMLTIPLAAIRYEQQDWRDDKESDESAP